MFLGNTLYGGWHLLAQQPIERMPAIDATRPPTARLAWQNPPPPGAFQAPTITRPFDAAPPNQFQPLPNFDPFASTPSPFTPLLPGAPSLGNSPTSASPFRLSDHKDTFFQKASFSSTWLAGDRINDVEVTELEVQLTVGVPLPDIDRAMLITAGFETSFLEGPLTPDLPGQVYSSYIQFIWVPKISERWRGMFGIEPGFYGDYESSDAEIFRLLGRAFLRYEWIPDRLQIIGGVAYLDRDDYNIVPAGGVIWRPNDDWLYQLIVPAPKIAYRFSWDGTTEYWAYFAAEVGGDSWGIQRASGAADKLMMLDIRTVMGVEKKLAGGAGARIEFGYVFARKITYGSTMVELKMDDAWMLRGVITY